MYRTRELLEGAQMLSADQFEVVACYDIDRAKADFAAERFGGQAYYAEEPFLKHDMDVVIISLPPYLHPEAFLHTAQAGKDVYLEKPVCVDLAGRELVLKAARDYPVKCYVGLSYRFIHPFLKVAEIVRRPDAGKLLGVHAHWLAPGPLLGPAPDPAKLGWRQRLEQSGGQLVFHCCHLLDWFRWIGGEMSSVTATSYTPPEAALPHEEVELNAGFTYEQGGLANFTLSQHSHQAYLYGSVETENYGMLWGWRPYSFVKVYRSRPRAADETFEWAGTDGVEDNTGAGRNALQMKDFIDAYLEGRPMPCNLQDGIASFDMACAIRESYREGRRVSVPPLVDLPA
jgi:predicted dehydrogenase